MNKPITQDERSRDAIVKEINTNLFIEAGAGSGKTTMLVNRMVAMVESGIPVEKICAITFTKNAALEFYERFQARLINRANPNKDNSFKRFGDLDEPTDITRQRCLKALENIDLCFMGTIDSFCNMVLAEHPTEANIPSDAKLVSNKEASGIYKQYYIDALGGKYGAEIRLFANRFAMLFWNAEETFASLMDEIMNRRNVNFVIDDELCAIDFKSFNKVRDDVKKVLKVFNKDLSKLTIKLGYSDTRDPMDVYKKANETLQKGWNYNYTGVQRALKDISNLTYNATKAELGFTNESIIREEADKIVLNIADEETEDALLFKLNDYKYQNALKLLLLSIEPLEEMMRKEGKFTFFDYLYYLRNMLVKDAHEGGRLIDYIYNRHSYFLIDEFQDTNPMQAEVFFLLTSQDSNKNSWKECLPKPGSLFIVGDPKQSIYRFRSADVASYLNIKKLFENEDIGKVLYLVNNFRSRNIMKNRFNDVFDEVMKEETSEQSKYLDIENIHAEEANEFEGIYYYEVYSESLLKDYPEMDDNKRLAYIVKDLVNDKKKYIRDSQTKELRNINYSDFMIIFASKKGIAPCISEFKKQNLPIKVEGKVLFEECEALKIISNIYQAITNRNDVVSLTSSLYSPLFGFNDNDLAAYRKAGNSIKIEINKEYGNSGIELALNKLKDISMSINTKTPSSLFEIIIDEFEIFKYVTSENLEIVYYVLELLRGEEHNGNIVTFKDATDYMNELVLGESDLERCLSLKQNTNAVHIANLHKVKGLEAPIVILAKAGSSANNPSIRIEYNDDENGTNAMGYIISITSEGSYTNLIETNRFNDKASDEKESLKKENDRLVYVAATRAKNALIISEPKRNGKNGPVAMGNKWKPLRIDKDVDFFKEYEILPIDNVNNETEAITADSIYANTVLVKVNNNESYKYKLPSDVLSTPKSNDEHVAVLNNQETYSTLVGTMVHRLMEMVIMSKDKLSKDACINNILDEYITIEFENNINIFREILEKVYITIHNGGYIQKGNVKQDILPILLEADEVYSEVPFTYKDDQTIWNGIIDLIYIKDNEVHIIDWKTNKDDSALDEHYKDQLNAYKAAVKQILNKDVEDALIYHIDIYQ